jgi:NTP pyrophosphatase (non-canonical NTP hydrolase)
MALEQLRLTLRQFAAERDWDQFHSPKNLVMAISSEVGELSELFQWLTQEESVAVMSTTSADDVRDELADLLIYLVRLADRLDVDLEEAALDKVAKNASRYPVAASKGTAWKYNRTRK